MAEHDTAWPVVVNDRRDESLGIDEARQLGRGPLLVPDVENPAPAPSRGRGQLISGAKVANSPALRD